MDEWGYFLKFSHTANVPFQHSALFIEALQRADIPFELMVSSLILIRGALRTLLMKKILYATQVVGIYNGIRII